MIFGLGAALAWGMADLGAAVVGRRIGSFGAAVVGQIAALIALTVLALAARPETADLGLAPLALAATGGLGALGYLAFYRGLQLGPISLVSVVGAGYGAVTVGLSLALLRESLSWASALAVGLTLVGVTLTSYDRRAAGIAGARTRPGIPYALVSMIAFGVGAFILGLYAKELGWLLAVLLTRLGSATMLLVVLLASRNSGFLRSSSRNLALAALVGVLDVAGLGGFAHGSELGLVSIAAAASAAYPLVPVVAGVAFFDERIAFSQWAGIVLVVGGLVLLGVAA